MVGWHVCREGSARLSIDDLKNVSKNPISLSRRRFVAASLVSLPGGLFSELPAAESNSPSEKLNVGVIGVGGRGIDNLAGVDGEHIAALCDVDERFLDEAASRYPKARRYRDFRKLLQADDLDAVMIATPDHTHALAAVTAMRRGLHVYCEKPLAHNLTETALMSRLAKEKEVATQMGNQFHASAGYRRVVQILQSDVLGEVGEVHAWTTRPVWPQGIRRPPETPPVPDSLDWDLWLGPAPKRPFHSAYHPRDWRGWWDFGSGALGDFVPHLLDPIYEGLRLTAPMRIKATTDDVNAETAPKSSLLEFQFETKPTTEEKSGKLVIHWYDGGKQPPPEKAGVKRLPGSGALVIGEHGRLFIPTHGKPPVVIPTDRDNPPELPEPLPPSEHSHWEEWTHACKTEEPTGSPFSYGAALTDVALLGNVAIRTGEPIVWNADTRRVTNVEKANAFLTRKYRRGWEPET